MELDGFCEDLQLAFEYQGEQHFTPGFYVGEEELGRRIEDDFEKVQVCNTRGVFLVQIYYWDDVDDYPMLIRDRLEKSGFPISSFDFSRPIDLDSVYENKSRMDEMRELARLKKGRCLSKRFVSMKHPLLWECDSKHRWFSPPSAVKRGDWCNECAGRKVHSYSHVKLFIESKGGHLLSKEYLNNKTKIRIRCAIGHEWETAFNGVLNRGTWCPFCSPTAKGTINEMREIAASRGGKCLSPTYVNSSTKLRWSCANNHEWEARPGDVKWGQWCPHCAGNLPRTIEEMRDIAQSRGGDCLSSNYVNLATHLWWRCAKGHTWQASPNNVKGGPNKKGSWCPVCAANFPGTIDEMKAIAASRGGECLSSTYVNSSTKLRWRCANDHEWEALPREVKGRLNKKTGKRQGTWCKVCSYAGGRKKKQVD